ncbi:MAG: hypothetical protein AB1758_26870 [Candidatus Eremiobacterota bacterium]
MAAELTPGDIVERGTYLGAGVGGGAYSIEWGGTAYVAKQWGHPDSVAGQWHAYQPRQLELQAIKQFAVQNALAVAGIPAPVSAILVSDPTWVLMEKVEGLDLLQLSQEERAQAVAAQEALERQAEPVILATLDELKQQHPDGELCFRYAPDISSNSRFARTPTGIQLVGVFDPVI